MKKYTAAAIVALAGLTSLGAAQDVVFELVQTEDISILSSATTTFFVGSNPSAIAWDGRSLFVGGFENSGLGAETQIAQIIDFLDGPILRSFATVGGSVANTAPFRNRPGLDWDDELGLLASHDLGNSADPAQFQVFTRNLDNLTLSVSTESFAGRGIAGPSWDYGPGGTGFTRTDGSVGPIAAILDFSESGAIGKLGPIGLDPFDLSVNYFVEEDDSNGTFYGGGGPDISFFGVDDTLWRDIDINPDGGIAARVTQDLVIAERGSNNIQTSVIKIDDPTDDGFVNGVNVSWVYDVPCLAEDIIVWNDRGLGANGSGTLTDILRVNARDGSAMTFDIVDSLGTSITTFATANAYYDFAWDPDLQLLFVCEFTSRQVYVLTPVCGSPCLADMNGDGILDNGDIGAFVQLFLLGDLAADFNGDGILDNGDIGAFVNAFLAGC